MTGTHTSLAHLVPPPVRGYQRAEIANGLRRVCTTSELYWNAMPDEEFVAPLGTAWSPADHVRHLTLSVRAVSKGLRVPRLLLRLRFGRPARVSMSWDALVSKYHAALRAGGKAGNYAPRPQPVGGDPGAYRRELLEKHRREVLGLARQTLDWSRRQVDGICLPHPLLGRLTVREILMFTLYHNQHHLYVVARRRGEYFSDATPLS
jgi:hypothetical protein